MIIFKIIKRVAIPIIILGAMGFGLDRLLDVNDFRQCRLASGTTISTATNCLGVPGTNCLPMVSAQKPSTEKPSDSSIHPCPTADAVVVISGGDTKARTQYAATITKAQQIPVLITAGASRQENVQSNAEEMRQIAIDAGVPVGAIKIEPQSRNTHQNAVNVKKLIEEYNQQNPYKPINSLILVTSGYHQARAYKEFRSQFASEFKIYNAPLKQDRDWSPTWYLSPRSWYLAVKEAGGLLLVSGK